MEMYKYSDFKAVGFSSNILQINYSYSSKGILRGLHYQVFPAAQAKLVRVISGKVFDVGVDIRKGSPTYLDWVGVELSSDNRKILCLPEGFAHGFYVMSDYAEIEYCCSAEYSPEHERSIIWNDPDINIDWPDQNPELSDKDKEAGFFQDSKDCFYYEG